VPLKARALRLLAQREHSRAELQRKLLARACARVRADPVDGPLDEDEALAAMTQLKAEVTAALDDLEAHGLLSDARTADAVLLAKSPRYGSRRLRQLLQAKSLDPGLVSDRLAVAKDSEFERAQNLWLRRFGQPPADLRERARQQRFLAGRGFESAVIERVLKAAGRVGSTEADPED
jgi:regulatory protein